MVSDGESKQNDPGAADPWERLLRHAERRAGVVHGVNRDGQPEWRVKSRYLLGEIIGIPPERTTQVHGARLRTIMNKYGWSGPREIRFKDCTTKGYTKLDITDPVRSIAAHQGEDNEQSRQKTQL